MSGLSRRCSGHADNLGGAERVEAIDKGDPDVDLGGLAIGIPRSDALIESLQAWHFGLHAAAGVISGHRFQNARPERRVARRFSLRALAAGPSSFPSPTVASDRYDCKAAARDDGTVAAAGIVGAICGHGTNVLVRRDLAKQDRRDGAVTFPARCELDRADVRCGSVHRQMHLVPLETTLNAMLAGLPFAVAEKLGSGAVHQLGDKGSAPSGCSACGTASSSPKQANPAQQGAGDPRSSRLSA